MRNVLIAAGVLTAFVGAGAGVAMQSSKPGATAVLSDANGVRKGMARFTDTPSGLAVTVEGSGLPQGTKGLHIHTVGKCEGPKFETAAGHWNPTVSKHGMENPAGPHLGDLRSIAIAANGSGRATATIAGARLRGGSNALLDADGAAIIIHAAPDDYKTDPSGNSGDRIACGVIRPA